MSILGTGCSPCTRSTGKGNDCVDSNSMNGKAIFGRRANQSWFPGFVVISQISWPEFRSRWRYSCRSWPFGKKDPLRANFQNCFPKGFTTSQIHVFCANFVKFGWPEIGKIVRYLHDKKKTKFRLILPLSLLLGSCPKSARASCRQYTLCTLNFIQIRSLLVEL